MVRTILLVLVLVTALSAVSLLSRASERTGGTVPPSREVAHLLVDPLEGLPDAAPRGEKKERDHDLPPAPDDHEAPPQPIEQRFLAIEQDLRAREESCRIAEQVLRDGELEDLRALFTACARTRDPRIRAGVLRAVRLAPPRREGIDWPLLERLCSPGAEGVAARIGIRAGLGRHGACLWLARLEDATAQRNVIDAIVEGLTAREAEDLATWCRRAPLAPGVERLLMHLED